MRTNARGSTGKRRVARTGRKPAAYSACLVAKIEETIQTGAAPFPAERTPIVSGALESCLTSQQQGGKRLETPHLDVAYTSYETPPLRPETGRPSGAATEPWRPE